jgi:ATP-dependent DNA helicase RecG
VGTGKTAVALYAMLVAVRNGFQAALMAPTEVLAEQHHRTISKALEKHPVRIGILTGSIRAGARRSVLEGISAGAVHLVVGTHAILQDPVVFKKLGLAIVDEQHRFGVKERMRLRRKGGSPHVLVMTATPIPRSLCLTGYGDLDLTVIRERPAGRKPVKTVLITEKLRPRAMDFIRAELARGRQAYFVYPLIDESETLALPAAVKARERLSRELPGRRVGLVHGNLSAAEKEEELDAFRSGRTHVLVATVVVEVGIDVPNATVLFLEDASRFGLAQLHQLRGRVGRGAHPGHCLIGLEGASADVRRRLRVFASTDDGFRIAEEDLRLRGPGDFLGVRQSGRPHFLLGNPLEDLDGFLRVRKLADRFWEEEGSEPERARWRARIEAEAAPEGEDREVFVGLD